MLTASCWSKTLAIVALLVGPFFSGGAMAAELSGILTEKGTRTPLSGVNVYVLPHQLKGLTDSEGKFAISNVPEGEAQVVVNSAGYNRLDFPITVGSESSPLTLYLERTNYQVFETTIYGKGKKRDDSQKTIGQSEFKAAGSGGDPVRAVQNLPGVNRANSISSQIIIQGSAPNQTKFLIENQEVPIIFHFGGLSSVIMPEALERVDYLSAGYGAEYGRALGGLVGVWTKNPREDRLGGFAFVDLLNAGGLVEGKAGEKGSFLLSARQSYIGSVLRAVAPKDNSFDLTVAPEFRDLTGVYRYKLSDQTEFKFVATGSQDSLEFLLKKPVETDPGIRGAFSNQTGFYRLIPSLTLRFSENRTARFSMGYGNDSIKVNVGSNFFRLSNQSLTMRAELEEKASPEWTHILGMDHRFRFARVDLDLPTFVSSGGVSNPLSTGASQRFGTDVSYGDYGLYWRGNWIPHAESPWTVSPMLRLDRLGQTREFLPAPRFSIRRALDESSAVRLAGGLYFQNPEEQETSPTLGNPNLKAPRAIHGVIGYEKDFRGGQEEGFTLQSGLFYRQFDRLVIREKRISSVPYNNDGKGRAYGLEVWGRYQSKRLTGWLAYTLSRSTRWDPSTSEYVFAYDQTHLVTALGSVQLGKNWVLSTRVRYVTGNPFTPVVGGVLDSDNDVYIPIRGTFYSERYSPFFQTDIRLDKKWIYDKWILSFYLDLLNATNASNVQSVSYSYDYQSKAIVKGLPLLPLLGVKGEF